jgi:transcriptional regulator with XRE-family HTH domain
MKELKGLKATREDLGYSRKFIIKNVGITLANLSLIESGKSVPTKETRKKIITVLETKVNWLDTEVLKNGMSIKSNWYSTEKTFRFLIKKITGLTPDEKKAFIESAIRHLNNILTKEEE